jgi:hypothetical protein
MAEASIGPSVFRAITARSNAGTNTGSIKESLQSLGIDSELIDVLTVVGLGATEMILTATNDLVLENEESINDQFSEWQDGVATSSGASTDALAEAFLRDKVEVFQITSDVPDKRVGESSKPSVSKAAAAPARSGLDFSVIQRSFLPDACCVVGVTHGEVQDNLSRALQDQGIVVVEEGYVESSEMPELVRPLDSQVPLSLSGVLFASHVLVHTVTDLSYITENMSRIQVAMEYSDLDPSMFKNPREVFENRDMLLAAFNTKIQGLVRSIPETDDNSNDLRNLSIGSRDPATLRDKLSRQGNVRKSMLLSAANNIREQAMIQNINRAIAESDSGLVAVVGEFHVKSLVGVGEISGKEVMNFNTPQEFLTIFNQGDRSSRK